MKIGLDLDGTLYGFPKFFKAMIESMVRDGHEFFCTSNWQRSKWDWHRKKIAYLDIDPDLISPELLDNERHFLRKDGPQNKARMADLLDIVFDDHADHIQHLTATPIMKCPAKIGKKRPSDEEVENKGIIK